MPNTIKRKEGVSGAIFNLPKVEYSPFWPSQNLLAFYGRKESLLFLKEGKPLPAPNKTDPIFRVGGFIRKEIKLRDRGKSFSPDHPSNLLLKLRAFLGVNSRAEVAAYLLTHEQANASEMARACWYSQRAVHDALVETRRSQLIHSFEKGREIGYFIQRDRWEKFFRVISPLPEWRNWPLIFGLLHRIHEKLNDEKIGQASGEALNSELILFVRNLKPAIDEAGLGKIWVRLFPESARIGVEALEKMISEILDEISK